MTSNIAPSITVLHSLQREIHVRVWAPDCEVQKVLVLSHGMAEHIDRYAGFANYALEHNIAVIGANHRGHGEEAQCQGHFADKEGWSLVLRDLDCIVDYAQERFQAPVILIGHSMGSFIARHYSILHGDKLQGLVLCGSDYQASWMFKLAAAVAKSQAVMFGQRHPSAFLDRVSFGSFNAHFKPTRTRMDWLNRVEDEVDKYLQDPYCGFLCTTQFWLDFMHGLDWSSQPQHLQRIPAHLPILVTSGEQDPVSRMAKGAQALQQALRTAGVNRVDLTLYPQARHELFLEQNKLEFYADLLEWIKQI